MVVVFYLFFWFHPSLVGLNGSKGWDHEVLHNSDPRRKGAETVRFQKADMFI